MVKKIEKKLVSILLSFYSVYFFINILQKVYLKVNGYGYRNMSWTQILIENTIIEIVNTVLLMIIIIHFSKWLLNKKINLTLLIVIHAFMSVLTGIMFSFIYVIVQYIIGNVFYELTLNNLFTSSVRYLNTHFLIYFTSVFIIYTYYYINKSTHIELQKTQLKQQLANAQVNILKYQLHPHFFFNTLNSISSLIETDTKLAQNTLADFSDLLRDILFLKDTNLMPLSVEMRILKRYIDIMSIRFSDHLIIEIKIEENLGDIMIPSLIMQPILENSIKHGYSRQITDLKISLDIFKKASFLNILISNNGCKLSESMSFGTGLQNTIDRLDTLYENNYSFTFENQLNKSGVITKIIIPVE